MTVNYVSTTDSGGSRYFFKGGATQVCIFIVQERDLKMPKMENFEIKYSGYNPHTPPQIRYFVTVLDRPVDHF